MSKKSLHLHAIPVLMVSFGVSLFMAAAVVQLRTFGTANTAAALSTPAVSVSATSNGLANISAGSPQQIGFSYQTPDLFHGVTELKITSHTKVLF